MPVETFTKLQFEDALKGMKPAIAAQVGGQPDWTYRGVEKHEHCYTVRPYPAKPFRILIRSSVHESGVSAGCGEDSIRAALVDDDGTKVGGSIIRWTTRLAGWPGRLEKLILTLADIIRRVEPCATCGQLIRPYRVHKEGKNKGRCFLACSADCPKKVFIWLDENELTETCGGCGRNLVQRTAGDQSQRPGEDYITCPASCAGSWRWAQGAAKPSARPAPARKPTPPAGADQGYPGATVGLAQAKRTQAALYHDPARAEDRAIGTACADARPALGKSGRLLDLCRWTAVELDLLGSPAAQRLADRIRKELASL